MRVLQPSRAGTNNLSPGITLQQAKTLVSLRPFEDVDDFNTKLSRKNKTGLSKNILVYCKELFQSYSTVDSVLEKCEGIGVELRVAIDKWNIEKAPEPSSSKLAIDEDDGSLALVESLPAGYESEGDFIVKQPSLLSDIVLLKEYQLLGVNWMYLLYQRGLSCILADEMGKIRTFNLWDICDLSELLRFGEDCSGHCIPRTFKGT